MFKAKVYKLGKSGRVAIMVPKEVVLEPGEYEVEAKKLETQPESAIPTAEPILP